MKEEQPKMILSTVLCLLLVTNVTQSIEFPNYRHQYSFNSTDVFEFSTDIMDDHSSAVVVREYNDGKIGLSIKIFGPNNILNTCYLPFELSTNMQKRYGDRLARLSNETVLLSAYEEKRLKLILVNTENCQYRYAYDGALSEKRHWIFKSKNLYDESFTILMHGKEYCRGYPWCKLFFNPRSEPIQPEFQPIDFDFDKKTEVMFNVKPAASIHENLWTAYIDNINANTLKVRLYEFSNYSAVPKYKDLFSLQNMLNNKRSAPHIMIESSDLSYCWGTTDLGNKTIHCSLFQKDGSLIFNQTLVNVDPLLLWRIVTIPNGIVVINRKADSDEIDFERPLVQASAIISNSSNESSGQPSIEQSRSVRIKQYQFKLACRHVIAWKAKLHESDGSIEVEYMCFDNHYTEGRMLFGTSIHTLFM